MDYINRQLTIVAMCIHLQICSDTLTSVILFCPEIFAPNFIGRTQTLLRWGIRATDNDSSDTIL
jgi:hypothetical protein